MAKKSNTSTAHIVITMEGKSARNVMKAIAQQAQNVRKELVAMEQAGKMDTDEYKDKISELKSLERAVQQNKTAYIDLDRTVKNLNKTTLRDLQRSLKECRKQMQNLTADDPKMAKLMAQYRAIDNQIGKITGQWKRQDGAIKSVFNRLPAYVSLYGTFNFVTGQIKQITEKNLALSDSYADIRKASGLSADEVSRLSDEIQALDTRTTTEDLHQLAFEGARLGIQGVEGLMQFVKAGNQIRVALGEDLGDDALVELMKMNEVMGTTKELGIEKAMLATGSAINLLSASSTASGSQIADFASRLSGIATQANITTDELLGLGSASSSLNLQTEVAATAFNKFINEIVAHTSTVAKAAGVEKEVLEDLLKSGKSMEAVVVVLEALNGKGGLRGLDAIMGDLGSDGARLNQVLAAFASNTDVLRKHLNLSTDAFREATSVTNEYNIKNENAAALLARIKNALIELTTNSTVTKWLEDVLRKLFYLPQTIEENKTAIVGALTAIANAILVLKLNLSSLTKFGLLRMIVTLRTGLTSVATIITTKLTPALTRLFSFMAAHPFVAAATALTVFVGVCIDAYKRIDFLGKAQKRLNDLSGEYETVLGKETTHVSQLFGWLEKAKKGTEEYDAAKNAIIKNYGKYLEGLGKEIETLENVKGAYEAITKAATDAAKARMAEKGLAAANETYAKDTGEQYKSIYDRLIGSKKYSKEEADSLISQLRKSIDNNTEIPAELKAFADTYKGSFTMPTSWGMPYTVDSDPVNDAISLLKKRKKALDVEVQEIETKYGKLTEVLSGGKKKEIILPDEPVDEKEEAKKKRLALEAAKDEHKAVMAAIEIYYKQQQQVINDAYLNKKITIAQREQELADIEMRFAESRYAARAFLHNEPGAEDKWYENLTKMQDENLSHTERTNAALKNLWDKDLQDIGDRLRRFGEGEMDGIWKEMETDLTKIQETKIKFAEEVEQILRQYDFEAQVTEKFIAALQKLNIFFPSMTENMKEGAAQAMADLNAIYPKLFSIDINTEEGVASFKKLLSEAKGLSTETLNLAAQDLQLLYYKTLEYGDAMVEAQEKARNRGVKVGTAAYEQTDQYKGNQKRVKTAEETVNVYKSAEALGLASDIMVQDQEVKLYEARLQAAQDYYNYLQSTGRDTKEAELQLQEATAELASAMVEKTKEQFDVLRSYGKNLEDFGTDFGEAIFGSIDDRRDALEDFVRAIGKTTQELIMNWVKQKIEHAILRKAMVKMEQDSQEEMTDASTKGSKDEKEAIEQGGKDALKTMARAAKKRLGLLKDEKKEEVKTEEQGQEQQTAVVEAGGEIQAAVTDQIGNMIVSKKKTQAAENVSTEAAETSANATMGIASGAAKTIGELGWWGIPLVAVITALINGLLSMAMSKVGSLFGGSAQGATAPTKLVTGLLTYDSGNVQSVLGSDGHVYSARVGGVNGSGIVSVPTLTNVGGQAALVGEQGPEIVIGRATTRAMMQDNPALLAGLVQFDKMYSGRGFRTYAGGNVQQYGANGEQLTPEEQEAQQMERIMSVVSATLMPALEGMTRAMNASNRTTAALNERLKLPFNTIINKYGKGGLVDEVASGLEQEKKSGRNETVRRLFGSVKK